MPELPEVETIRRGLAPVMTAGPIRDIRIRRYDLRRPVPAGFAEILSGQRVNKLDRRGKYIIGTLANKRAFVLHLGMSGRVRIYPAQEDYAGEKHDHVIFTMESGARIVFNDPRRFGMLYLAELADWQAERPFLGMGPEPLSGAFDGPGLAKALSRRAGPVKTALLDQSVVAGVGNIYACEALFMAAIHPEKPARELTAAQCTVLARCIRDVLKKAIEAGGSTLKDYAHTDGSLGYFQAQFSVYDREGFACPGCDCRLESTKGVKRIVQSGRSSFLCPVKQVL